MSEKMREEFNAWWHETYFADEDKKSKYRTSHVADIAFDAYQAALRTHENGGQESEAGAVGGKYRVEIENGSITHVAYVDDLEFGKAIVDAFVAPPSAPAIEAAAIMKCAEVCESEKVEASDSEEDQAYNRAIDHAKNAILALIPQDGRTQLESLLAECRKEVRKEAYKEALEVAQEYGIEGINRELRRMAEGEKN